MMRCGRRLCDMDRTMPLRPADGRTNSTVNVTYMMRYVYNASYSSQITGVISTFAFDGVTPSNLFRKGTDRVPDSDCRGDVAQPSGGVAPGGETSSATDVVIT